MKKIRLDFTKTEDKGSYNTRQIPEGLYRAKVVGVKQTEAQDGTAMLVYGLTPTDSKYRSRHFPYYCKLQQNQLWKLRDLLVAAGETVPKKALQIDPEKVVGRELVIEVEDDSYNGNVRSQVQGTYGLDILEDSEEAEEGEDYEDDEVEEEDDYEDDLDDEEDDDYDEDEELDEEDEDDLDEEDLDLDEDDLDEDDEEFDEDDFDDEDEEEEEEPAPAPKRKAVAKRPAAKKAPAKRTARRK